MSRKVLQVLGAVVVAGLIQLSAAAQDVGYETAYDDATNIGALEAQTVALSRRLDDAVADEAYDEGGCGGCCKKSCCSTRWYAGTELVWVKPHYEDHEAFTTFTTGGVAGFTVDTAFDADYEITPRFWLGYKDCEGFGARTRYWEYDHTVDAVAANNTVAGQQLGSVVGNNQFDAISAFVDQVFSSPP